MPAGANGRAHLSIGEVLSLLQEEFPDVTISKIRFLESQGLLDPERTPSGYRKFYDDDIERLRWILRLQKDHYLPLKVIKDRLDEHGGVPPATNGSGVLPLPGVGSNDVTEEIIEPAADPARAAGAPATGATSATGAGAGGAAAAPPPPAAGGRDANARSESRTREVRHSDRAPRSGAGRGGGAGGAPTDGSGTTSSAAPTRPGATSAAAPSPGTTRSGRSAAGAGTSGATGATGSGAGSGARSGANASGASPAAPGSDGAASAPTPPRAPGGRRAAGGGARRPGAGAAGSRGPSGSTGAPGGAGSSPATGGGYGTAGPRGSSGAGGVSGASRPGFGADPGSRLNGHAAYDPGPDAVSLTADELAEASGLSLRDIRDLERFGLIEPRQGADGGTYDGDALIVARTAAGFLQHGIEARHMRTYKVAVDREAGLFQQIVSPVLKQRNPEARSRAARTVTELIRLGEVMRGVLLRRELRDHLGGG